MSSQGGGRRCLLASENQPVGTARKMDRSPGLPPHPQLGGPQGPALDLPNGSVIENGKEIIGYFSF